MIITHRLLRRTAAVLASLSLLAAPARGVLACEMEPAAAAVAPSQERHEAHAEHHGTMKEGNAAAPTSHSTEAPAGQSHPPCDHLVGCAPVAVLNGAARLSALTTTTVPVVPFVAMAAPSPARVLDPPPPKR